VFSGLGTSVGFMLFEELHRAPNEGCRLAVRPPVRRQDAMLVSSLRSGHSAIREGVYVHDRRGAVLAPSVGVVPRNSSLGRAAHVSSRPKG
jgi:hypothetical protein